MIEDEELRDLFEVESEEKIHSIESNLKKIEANFRNEAVWNELLRDVHTIKGSARMLKIKSIEIVAHRFEGILQHFKDSKAQISPSQIKLCYEILDAIHLLTQEEIGGPSANIHVAALLQKISQTIQEEFIFSSFPAEPKLQPPLPSLSAHKIERTPKRKEFFEKTSNHSHPFPNPEMHISTIRVNVDQINQLMNEVTELSIVKTAIEQLHTQIDSLVKQWEEKKTLRRSADLQPLDLTLEEKLKILQGQAHEPIHKLQGISSKLIHLVRHLTLFPISKLFDLFPPMVREIASSCGKDVDFVITSEEIGVDRKIMDNLKDPLTHLLRNAISHGIEAVEIRQTLGKNRRGRIELKAFQAEQSIVIEVSDDGSGLDFEKIKQRAQDSKLFSHEELEHQTPQELMELIFLPGFSTSKNPSDISGRGIGLDIVKKMVQDCSGHISVRSQAGSGCTFSIELPLEFVTNRVLLISQNKEIYAIPSEMIDASLQIKGEQLFSVEGQDMIHLSQNPYPVYFFTNFLCKIKPPPELPLPLNAPIPCLMVRKFEKHIGLIVDEILEEQELVIFPNKMPLFDQKGIIGTTILKNGNVCMVIDPFEFIHLTDGSHRPSPPTETLHLNKKKSILLVDDSSISRLILKNALEEKNYQVTLATDGLQALEHLNKMKFDAMITDIEMPHMNGLELTSQIRTQHYNYILPIIMISNLSSSKDREKGLKAGANAYLPKSELNQQTIVATLEEFLK
ncbi:response regulator [Parachlamydia sp. AcF125]|uniref:hybrid sensor histidine kinase/response regulator n=1 Tax=Parachlamydia sp. AcF125 TaxID=2795736 RepID=UPI001BC97D79|nr:response regulator [Parachlamydia sp. AcF125]MBS4168697.1 Gliding motility regulatory protein [Parachlamydia sp. AcF125]